MGHAQVENRTPFAYETLYATDDDNRPQSVCLVQGSYTLSPTGPPTLTESPVPILLAGSKHFPDAESSSYKYEPQIAWRKVGTDVILSGDACAPRPVRETVVRVRVGPLKKEAIVFGDRYWTKTLGSISGSEATPFERMPLVYERAFGGWDRTHPDSSQHTFEPRNPVGSGFRRKHGKFEDGVRMPNLEDPEHRIREYGQAAPPTGFGFTSPNWQPRCELGGTYDVHWRNERMPCLPRDFDPRFFNAASHGLFAAGYLRGDEPVCVENASPYGTISFTLPGVPPPNCRVQLTGRRDALVTTDLDTVIVDTNDNLLLLIWRGHLALRNGPHDVVAIQIQENGVLSGNAAR